MSIAIGTVTISGTEDRRLQLGNSQSARIINIGTSWTKIRVGIRFAVDDTGAALGGTPRLCLGMVSSPLNPLTNGPLGSATTHFVGMTTVFASWTRNAGPPVRYTGTSPCFAAAKKIGDTFTVSNLNTAGGFSATPASRRVIAIVDITKGSPNFTFRAVYPFNSSTMPDVSAAQFKTIFETDDTAAIKTYTDATFGVNSYIPTSDSTLAVDEATGGFLNAVCVSWDRIVPVLYVSDFLWRKIS